MSEVTALFLFLFLHFPGSNHPRPSSEFCRCVPPLLVGLLSSRPSTAILFPEVLMTCRSTQLRIEGAVVSREGYWSRRPVPRCFTLLLVIRAAFRWDDPIRCIPGCIPAAGPDRSLLSSEKDWTPIRAVLDAFTLFEAVHRAFFFPTVCARTCCCVIVVPSPPRSPRGTVLALPSVVSCPCYIATKEGKISRRGEDTKFFCYVFVFFCFVCREIRSGCFSAFFTQLNR